MSVVLLRLPEVETSPNGRPRHCPYCGSQILQRWGRVSKTVKDPDHMVAEVHRYRCTDCDRTFRDYPEGVDRASRTQRIRHLAALAWAMGLSCRDVVSIFKGLGVSLSRMTVWREGQALVDQLHELGETVLQTTYSLERIFPHNQPPGYGVKVAIDLGPGKVFVLGTLDEHNPREVRSWLKPLADHMELEVAIMGTGRLNPLLAPPQRGGLRPA
jgi:DNA-directed RNA polymerase subunit RPC12/RpoP